VQGRPHWFPARSSSQIWRAGEADLVAARVGAGVELLAGIGRTTSDHRGGVDLLSKGRLDGLAMWIGRATAGQPSRSYLVRAVGGSTFSFALDSRRRGEPHRAE
jgi:hypothetical protein